MFKKALLIICLNLIKLLKYQFNTKYQIPNATINHNMLLYTCKSLHMKAKKDTFLDKGV